MNISVTLHEACPLVSVEGRLDTANYRELESQFDDLLKTVTCEIYVDLSELEYIASSGLRVLLATEKRLRAMHYHLILIGMQPFVKEVFQVSGFSSIFESREHL